MSELGPPQRPFRRLAIGLHAAVVATAAVLALLVWPLGGYACRTESPTDLGLVRADMPMEAHEGAFVRLSGALEPTGAVELATPIGGDRLRAFSFRESPELRVVVRTLPGTASEVLPHLFAGRLTHLHGWSLRFGSLAGASDLWLLEDGFSPSDARWALGLLGLLGLMATWSVYSLVVLLRPLPARTPNQVPS